MAEHKHRPIIRNTSASGSEEGWRIVCEGCGIMLDFRPLAQVLRVGSAPEFTMADWEVQPYEHIARKKC